MSSILNTVMTEFRVVGTGIQAGMGQLVGGTTRWTRSINDATRQSEKLTALWRAFGTTFRYAIAGQIVFGLGRMVTQLKEVQTQMGLISAIGSKPGPGGSQLALSGNDLRGLQADIRKGMIDARTPIQDYNDAVINLYSTLQDVPPDKVTKLVTTIARAAKLAQVGAEDAMKAFTTLPGAFGMKLNDQNRQVMVERMAQEFFILTKEAPGGKVAGQQMIQQMGQLAALTRQAGGTPENMFGLMLSGLRGGIPPAQSSRALQFFLQTLAFPKQLTKEGRTALAGVGITPTSNLPLMEKLNRLFKRAGVLGIRGDLNKVMSLDEATMDTLDENQDLTSSLGQMGISGQGAVFLGSVFHRIHALRMALALSTQIEMGNFQEDMKTMTDVPKGIIKDTNRLSVAWKKYEEQSPLEAAAIAVEAFRIQVQQDVLAPVLKYPALGILKGVRAQQGHEDITRDIIFGGLGAGLLFGGRKFIRGLGSRGVPALAAAQSLATGNNELGTLTNPMFVIIVGDMTSIFNPGRNRVPTPYGPVERPGGRLPGDKPEAPTRRGRAGRLLSSGAKLAGTVAVAPVVGDVYQSLFHPDQPGVFDPDFWTMKQTKKGFVYKALHSGPSGIDIAKSIGGFFGIGGGGGDDDRQRALKRAQTAKTAQDMFWAGGGQSEGTDVLFGAGGDKKKELTLNINLKHPDGSKEKKRVHLPVTQYQNGKHPTQGGSAAKARR